MSKYVELQTSYRLSEINLDNIALKVYNRSKKKIVKLFYKPNKSIHTDFLFQTPELLIKKDIKYNKKGYFELEVPLLGKKQEKIKLFKTFLEEMETKIVEILKKNKAWFKDKNIKFKSVIRYSTTKNDIYKLLRLKIDSDTLIKKDEKYIDINNIKKDSYVKLILKLSYIYIKDSFVTINIYPLLIDVKSKVTKMSFAESDSDISSDLSTSSEQEVGEDEVVINKKVVEEVLEEVEEKEVEEEPEEVLEELLEEVEEEPQEPEKELEKEVEEVEEKEVIEEEPVLEEKNKIELNTGHLKDDSNDCNYSSDINDNINSDEQGVDLILEISKDKRDDCGLQDMFNNNFSLISSEEKVKKNIDENIIIPLNNEEIEVNIDGDNIDSETSYMSNLNSENFIETYGIHIQELELSDVTNGSSNSEYSEEINSDEINDYESQIL